MQQKPLLEKEILEIPQHNTVCEKHPQCPHRKKNPENKGDKRHLDIICRNHKEHIPLITRRIDPHRRPVPDIIQRLVHVSIP